jgi:tRNA (cmo5U34)-methyltransferase
MSEQIARGFDRLAPFYDSLARLIIGKGIKQSQLYFLNHLSNKSKLLVLGGGTGWILPHLFKINPELEIHYIDVSKNMIAQARQKMPAANKIQFIVGTSDNITDRDFDCVITNFYLDLFDNATLNVLVPQIKGSLLPDAYWLATDFVSVARWHRLMLWLMYRFFRLTTGLRNLQLPEWQVRLANAGGTLIDQKQFSRNFIKAVVFRF